MKSYNCVTVYDLEIHITKRLYFTKRINLCSSNFSFHKHQTIIMIEICIRKILNYLLHKNQKSTYIFCRKKFAQFRDYFQTENNSIFTKGNNTWVKGWHRFSNNIKRVYYNGRIFYIVFIGWIIFRSICRQREREVVIVISKVYL